MSFRKDITKEQLVKMYVEQKMSISGIARMLKSDFMTIYRHLSKENIAIRIIKKKQRFCTDCGKLLKSSTGKKCGSCACKGKKFSKAHLDNLRKSHLGQRVSEATKRKISDIFKKRIGDKNPNWKGGRTEINEKIRASEKYLEWRSSVFIRDNFTCQDCGDDSGGNLEAHHKKPFYILVQEAMKYLPLLSVYDACMMYCPLWNIDNGITYCKKCHDKTRKIYK